MRPVRLDIDGFASFREPAVVDFTDADYFALVGPTGSGKSTVIDAITFALYGTAHRWERANAIAYALAPDHRTGAPSRSIFDVGGQRYQVVREVRRVGHRSSRRTRSLERFARPHRMPRPRDEATATEVLASEVREMTAGGRASSSAWSSTTSASASSCPRASSRGSSRPVLGPADILLKLLGAGHYEEIGKRAGRRAAEAEKEAEVYAEQLAHARARHRRGARRATADAARLDDVSARSPTRCSLTLRA